MNCKIYEKNNRGKKLNKPIILGERLSCSYKGTSGQMFDTLIPAKEQYIALAMDAKGERINGTMVVLHFDISAHGINLSGYQSHCSVKGGTVWYPQEWWCCTYVEERIANSARGK